jgi:polysaccharide pyruvyl transferase WcaK-like protein
MSQKPHKIAIWGAWYGSRNIGDQVLLLTITDILGQLLKDVRFIVFTDNPKHINQYTNKESQWDIHAIHNRYQFPELVWTMATSDLFIFGGGVPFYEEPMHVFAMALLVGLARIFRTPYMTWTVSSQIVKDPLAKRVFKWVLNGAQAITYRDEHTHELFKSCGLVEKEMFLSGDSGSWLEPSSPDMAEQIIARSGLRYSEKKLVALTPRTLRGPDGDAQSHYNVKTPAEYDLEVACFAAALDWLWEHGYQSIFVPMNTVAPDDDRIAARRIIRESVYGDCALFVDEEIRPRIAPLIYQRCEASMVARVHGSITAMIGNCPVMMYAFAPKHAGIMKSLGLSEFALLEDQASPERAVSMLEQLLIHQDEIRRRMDDRLIELRQEALIPANLALQVLQQNI